MDNERKNLEIPELTLRENETTSTNENETNFILVSEQASSTVAELPNSATVNETTVHLTDKAEQEVKHQHQSAPYTTANVQAHLQGDSTENTNKVFTTKVDDTQNHESQAATHRANERAVHDAPINNQTTQQTKVHKQNSKNSWTKPFVASLAGAILGCSIFTGGYYITTNAFGANNTPVQSSVPSNSYVQGTSSDTTTAEVVAAVEPGIVTVLTGDRMRNLTGNGSGIVYKNENGKIYIVTNAHVVSDASIVEVYRNDLGVDSSDSVEVVAVDTDNDIAVLVINNPQYEYPVTIAFEDTNTLRVGQKVIAVGSPYVATLGTSFSGSVTEGIISGLNREVTSTVSTGFYSSREVTQNYIQTDAAINGGNSGGALIDMNGNLVGINSAKISSAENMGLAISANDVIKAMEAMDVPLPDVVQ